MTETNNGHKMVLTLSLSVFRLFKHKKETARIYYLLRKLKFGWAGDVIMGHGIS